MGESPPSSFLPPGIAGDEPRQIAVPKRFAYDENRLNFEIHHLHLRHPIIDANLPCPWHEEVAVEGALVYEEVKRVAEAVDLEEEEMEEELEMMKSELVPISTHRSLGISPEEVVMSENHIE